MSMSTNFFHQYFVSGILDSNITEDGGEQCHRQIPFNYYLTFIVILSSIHILILLKWKNHLHYQVKEQKSTLFEKIFAIFCFISWAWTFYFKFITKKGLFILNPCHIVILIQIYLLMSKNTSLNRFIYSSWTGWLFGPYMATLIPHLNGINTFEVFLYYFEHLAIIPFGYLVLARRYGFMKPTFKNQMVSFSTIALYQFYVLAPFSRNTMVNLNFVLCHSPADPLFKYIGFYYFVLCTGFLNLMSYTSRWVSYFIIKIVYLPLKFIGIEQAIISQELKNNKVEQTRNRSSDKKNSQESIQTKDE